MNVSSCLPYDPVNDVPKGTFGRLSRTLCLSMHVMRVCTQNLDTVTTVAPANSDTKIASRPI